MTSDTLQFQCGHCGTTLTVPAQMAGVSGPCPSCGNTVTSPMPEPEVAPMAAPAPQWPPAAAAPPWSPPQGMPGGMPSQAELPPTPLGGGLPPRRAPGQQPLTASLPGAGGAPAWGSAPAGPGPLNAGLPGSPAQNHSRLIPGAPVLPGGPAGNGLGQGGIPGSLLGREVAHAPISPITQPLQSAPPSLSLGGTFPSAAPAAAQAGAPAKRQMANLREPRGAGFLRLAFAALFFLGFVGLVGFFLKDYLPPSILSLIRRDEAEDATPVAQAPGPVIPSAMPEPPVIPREAADKTGSGIAGTPEASPPPRGFDPLESTPGQGQETIARPPNAVAELSPTEGATDTGSPAMVPQQPSTGAASQTDATSLVMPSTAKSSDPLSPKDDDGLIPEEAKPAVQALKQFLAATTLEERLRHTLGADVMKPLMERYYGRASEGPVTVDRVQFVRLDPNPELGTGRHCILSLESKTWEFPVPVMLEEQPDGFKVDWLAFVEFKDRLLEKFFKTYQEGPMRFHVGIMRHHYFEDGVPNADRKDAFRINPAPPNSFQGYAFLEKDTDLAKELRTRLPWETHVWAIVDLEWKKLGSQQWVELHGVPQMHWHPLPAGPRPISTPQKTGDQAQAGTLRNGTGTGKSSLPPPGISKNGVGTAKPNETPPGIRKSTPGLPNTIKRPLPAGR